MIPLLLPAELPCADKPYLAVDLPDGGVFGWPELPSARRYETDYGWRGPSHVETPKDGLLRCASPDPDARRCRYDIPVTGALPTQVTAEAGAGNIYVALECSPGGNEPRASWTLPHDWLDVRVSYALPAPPPAPPSKTDIPLGAARHALDAAKRTLATCAETRCSDEVTTRRKALEAVLATDWSVVDRAPFETKDRLKRTGDRTRIRTGLPWASVEQVCYHTDMGECETTLRFYDSTLLVYRWDKLVDAHQVSWSDGRVSIGEDNGTLQLVVERDALRSRAP